MKNNYWLINVFTYCQNLNWVIHFKENYYFWFYFCGSTSVWAFKKKIYFFFQTCHYKIKHNGNFKNRFSADEVLAVLNLFFEMWKKNWSNIKNISVSCELSMLVSFGQKMENKINLCKLSPNACLIDIWQCFGTIANKWS